MSELTFLQRIAITWYRTFDSSGFLFILLKNKKKIIRVVIYMAFIASLFIFLNFMASFIVTNYPQYGTPILKLIGNSVLYTSIASSTFIIFYESIYSLDIREVLFELKNNKIKKRMNFFTFSLLSIVVWFIGLQLLYAYLISTIIKNSASVIPTQDELLLKFGSIAEKEAFAENFISRVEYYTDLYTLTFIAIALTFQYLMQKKDVRC